MFDAAKLAENVCIGHGRRHNSSRSVTACCSTAVRGRTDIVNRSMASCGMNV